MPGKEQEPMKEQSATQVTDKGLEIPVPKRSEVMDALKKAAKPKA